MPEQKSGSGFDGIAASYDRWYESPEGKYIDAQENELFLRLVKPEKGQTILELGCGTGHNVIFFQRLGLSVAGIEPAEAMLRIATARCGAEANLCPGDACALTFADKSFDIVAIITALEFMPNPEKALREAFRTSKKVIYLGLLNSLSIIGISRRIESFFKKSIYREAHFYSIRDIKRMVARIEPRAGVEWSSTLFFPWGWHHLLGGLDKKLSFHPNPYGGFLGVRLTKPE
jgi:ubiquinone/menaquinone biosynthesis C-methylase UbiE